MRKLQLTILTLLVYFNTFCQPSTIDYDFINSALKQVKKYDSTYFLLQDKSWRFYLSDDKFETYFKELKGKVETSILKEIIHNSRSHIVIKPHFDSTHISKRIGVHLITTSTVDSLQLSENNFVPLNKRLFYICSLPVFDNKKTFAIIDFGGGTRKLEMQGQKYLFKRTQSGWILIATFDNWTS